MVGSGEDHALQHAGGVGVLDARRRPGRGGDNDECGRTEVHVLAHADRPVHDVRRSVPGSCTTAMWSESYLPGATGVRRPASTIVFSVLPDTGLPVYERTDFLCAMAPGVSMAASLIFLEVDFDDAVATTTQVALDDLRVDGLAEV